MSTDLNQVKEGRQETRILLVDDDLSYAHLCKRYLRSDNQYSHIVISAASIAHATAMYRLDRFDCLLIDYNLPDGCGTDFVMDLKQQTGEGEIMPPAIVLTAENGKQPAVDALRTGVCDFMDKANTNKSALLRAVDNAIKIGRLEAANIVKMRELQAANILLVKRSDEIQRFYHTVSHEVKTPLTAILEFVAIVNDGLAGEVTEEQKTILGYALESCGQIANQFNDLLELARFETGKMSVKLAPCSIYEVFDHCVVAATPAAQDKGITVSISDKPDLPMVMMQRDRIIQVLANLINNAIKFTEEGGSVIVSAEVEDDAQRLRLCVSDTGVGIPPAALKKVFDRLYQVTPSSDAANGSGMGLGLSIASEIIALHGSRIELQSVVGQGSEFSFSLYTVDSVHAQGDWEKAA
ncbi:MAG: ATP-binding protein [Granulosicoccus sp.]